MSDSKVTHSDINQSMLIASPAKSTSSEWLFPSALSAIIAIALSASTIALVYLLTVSYPDSLPGPTWILAMISYMPLITAFLMFRNCLIQTYAICCVVLLTIWLLYPSAVGVGMVAGIPFGIGFFILTSLSVHLWSKRFPKEEILGIEWIVRYSCMFMITAYTVSMVYGNLVSHAIQLFRAPFLLQPISVFGFGSVEFLLIFTNACLAWWIYASVKTRRIIPIDFRLIDDCETQFGRAKRVISNPIVLLVFAWVTWSTIAGIITASHTDDNSSTRVIVATVTTPHVPWDDSLYETPLTHGAKVAVALGQEIAEQAKKTGAQFIVTPEFSLSVGRHESCHSLILNHLYPQIAGLGLYVVVGCHQESQKACSTENLALTLSPEGKIIGVYGKLKPIPRETSCYRPGVSVHTIPYDDKTRRPTFGISPLICYDMDFSGPTATAADMGASLILNPANDWEDVRHHYAVLVIRAIENRVAIVKAEQKFDPAIVDPYGNIIALGSTTSRKISGSVSLSTPLKISWIRQQMPYWICILIYSILVTFDVIIVFNLRRS